MRGSKWRAYVSDLGKNKRFIYFRHSLLSLLHRNAAPACFQLVFPDNSAGIASPVDSLFPEGLPNDQAFLESTIVNLTGNEDPSARVRDLEHQRLPLCVTQTTDWKQLKPFALPCAASILGLWILQVICFQQSAPFQLDLMTSLPAQDSSFYFSFVRIPNQALLLTKSKIYFLLLSLQFLSLFNLLLIPNRWTGKSVLWELAATFGTFLYNSIVPMLAIYYVILCIEGWADIIGCLAMLSSFGIMRILEKHMTSQVVLLAA
eukprot:Gregarina_sp_Pseudo_9__1832@NODE_224_length_3530_cov_15_940132_g208_i0_p2_GENE_NODE_224_length_3530_cov_15_940132_g208_i0NODE_224_length_3530_cov_15_940132_g208_i0_p2_ORF_typecomplete_len261_score4_96_NODE_224_length_3530_cov_15_940132_g208_i068850